MLLVQGFLELGLLWLMRSMVASSSSMIERSPLGAAKKKAVQRTTTIWNPSKMLTSISRNTSASPVKVLSSSSCVVEHSTVTRLMPF